MKSILFFIPFFALSAFGDKPKKPKTLSIPSSRAVSINNSRKQFCHSQIAYFLNFNELGTPMTASPDTKESNWSLDADTGITKGFVILKNGNRGTTEITKDGNDTNVLVTVEKGENTFSYIFALAPDVSRRECILKEIRIKEGQSEPKSFGYNECEELDKKRGRSTQSTAANQCLNLGHFLAVVQNKRIPFSTTDDQHLEQRGQ